MVEHFVAPSPIHGLGVFSSGFVPKGTKVWTFNAIIDREISKDELSSLPPHTVTLIVRHAEYRRDRRMFLLSGDGDHFMNHSDDPNIVNEGEDMVACRAIEPGDELLCNYRLPRFWPVATI